MPQWKDRGHEGKIFRTNNCGLVAVAIGLVAAGCGAPATQPRLPHDVFWHTRMVRPGIYIYSQDDVWFKKDVARLRRYGCSDVIMDLWLMNNTGGDIFVAKLDENAHLGVTVKARLVSQKGDVTTDYGFTCHLGGIGPADFCLVHQYPVGKGPVVLDRSYIYDYKARIPFSPEDDTEYADVEIEFPLIYYTIGHPEPFRVTVKRSMRVYWDD